MRLVILLSNGSTVPFPDRRNMDKGRGSFRKIPLSIISLIPAPLTTL